MEQRRLNERASPVRGITAREGSKYDRYHRTEAAVQCGVESLYNIIILRREKVEINFTCR